jgi:hypothetical protein
MVVKLYEDTGISVSRLQLLSMGFYKDMESDVVRYLWYGNSEEAPCC